MTNLHRWCLAVLILPVFLHAQNGNPAYLIYKSDGSKISYEAMIKEISGKDIVLFGELHNNSMSHWLELQVLKSLYKAKNGNIAMGAEMFESDNQMIFDEYLKGILPGKNLKAEAKLWPNHATDYQPLLSFSKENNIKVVATNIPRRYANLVYKKGFEGVKELDKSTKKLIAPMPIEYDANLPGYKAMVGMMGAGHGTENLPKAQAMKDATMAHFICSNLPKGGTFVHFNGRYHSDNDEGINWYIRKYNKKASIATITTEECKDINKFPEKSKKAAHYIIAVPSDMTKTY